MNQKQHLKRHFDTCHADVNHSHPLGSALRAEKLQPLKAEYSQRSSFDISFQIAKAMKPFTDGDFIKNVIIQAATRWFPDEDNRKDFVNIVQNTHLSLATVTRRSDESTDKSDTAQSVAMIRFVLENGSFQEELLELIPLTGKTTGLDVYLSLKNSILAHEVPLAKLVAITTDGAPSMTRKMTGFSG
ncbi:uncharacterized protein LOC117180553 [Belonocnema kinseyi]|uniref:uncharacterized protein LOC117180553 n=1 Tax=Belonocnema kinseyi TaxID=2817044 RepID=UPI00143DAFBA|nr:uncharacterized protein LOC117180553 [Belonocnema kinseyi]